MSLKAAVLASLMSGSQSIDAASTKPALQPLIDPHEGFSRSARLRETDLRSAFGWSTFQEGRYGDIYYRLSPDGEARFGPDIALREHYIEVHCTSEPKACEAWKEPLKLSFDGQTLTLSVQGHGAPWVRFRNANGTPLFDMPILEFERVGQFSIEDLDRVASIRLHDGRNHIETIDLAALPAVLAYLQWAMADEDSRKDALVESREAAPPNGTVHGDTIESGEQDEAFTPSLQINNYIVSATTSPSDRTTGLPSDGSEASGGSAHELVRVLEELLPFLRNEYADRQHRQTSQQANRDRLSAGSNRHHPRILTQRFADLPFSDTTPSAQESFGQLPQTPNLPDQQDPKAVIANNRRSDHAGMNQEHLIVLSKAEYDKLQPDRYVILPFSPKPSAEPESTDDSRKSPQPNSRGDGDSAMLLHRRSDEQEHHQEPFVVLSEAEYRELLERTVTPLPVLDTTPASPDLVKQLANGPEQPYEYAIKSRTATQPSNLLPFSDTTPVSPDLAKQLADEPAQPSQYADNSKTAAEPSNLLPFSDTTPASPDLIKQLADKPAQPYRYQVDGLSIAQPYDRPPFSDMPVDIPVLVENIDLTEREKNPDRFQDLLRELASPYLLSSQSLSNLSDLVSEIPRLALLDADQPVVVQMASQPRHAGLNQNIWHRPTVMKPSRVEDRGSPDVIVDGVTAASSHPGDAWQELMATGSSQDPVTIPSRELMMPASRPHTLVAETSPETTEIPSGKPLNRLIQKELVDAGYDPGPIDGIIGKRTEDALMLFSKERGLTIRDLPEGHALLEMLRTSRHPARMIAETNLEHRDLHSTDATTAKPRPSTSLSLDADQSVVIRLANRPRHADPIDGTAQHLPAMRPAGVWTPGTSSDGTSHATAPGHHPGQAWQDLAMQRSTNERSIVTRSTRHLPEARPAMQVGLSSTENAEIPSGRPLNRLIQKELADAGYDPGPIDGILGKKTKRALRMFSKEHGLPPEALPDGHELLTLIQSAPYPRTAMVETDAEQQTELNLAPSPSALILPSPPRPSFAGMKVVAHNQRQPDAHLKAPPMVRIAPSQRSSMIADEVARPTDDQEAIVFAVQQNLTFLGYHQGRVDGILDHDTQSALTTFLLDHGHDPKDFSFSPYLVDILRNARPGTGHVRHAMSRHADPLAVDEGVEGQDELSQVRRAQRPVSIFGSSWPQSETASSDAGATDFSVINIDRSTADQKTTLEPIGSEEPVIPAMMPRSAQIQGGEAQRSQAGVSTTAKTQPTPAPSNKRHSSDQAPILPQQRDRRKDGTEDEFELVTAIQRELNRLGYFSDAVDGIAGPSTKDAILRFQRDEAWEADGLATPELFEALKKKARR